MIPIPRLPWPSSCPPTPTSAGMRIPSSQQSRSCQGFRKMLFMYQSSFMMLIIVIFRRLPFQSLLSSIRQLPFVGKGWQRIHWTGGPHGQHGQYLYWLKYKEPNTGCWSSSSILMFAKVESTQKVK